VKHVWVRKRVEWKAKSGNTYARTALHQDPRRGATGSRPYVIRILIGDEQAVVRCGLREIAERQPSWEIAAEVGDGKHAISKANEVTPDVAVLEYALPLINGVEATRQIRARLPHTEVLIFTVHEADAVIEECLRAGARSYLSKSATVSQLVSAIEFLAVHKPFFTGKVAEILLDSFLAIPTPGVTQGIHLPALASEKLGATERSVLQLMAEGHSDEHIAKHFNMNVKLVRELVNYAVRNGLVED
jgi:DNA-binding NarL/FixJ family response regulator